MSARLASGVGVAVRAACAATTVRSRRSATGDREHPQPGRHASRAGQRRYAGTSRPGASRPATGYHCRLSRSSTHGGSSLNAPHAVSSAQRRLGILAAANAVCRIRLRSAERRDRGAHVTGGRMSDRLRRRHALSERFPIYTRANVGEVFPGPGHAADPRHRAVAGRARLARRLGADRRVRPRRVPAGRATASSACCGGYCYLNASLDPALRRACPGSVVAADGRAVLRSAARASRRTRRWPATSART